MRVSEPPPLFTLGLILPVRYLSLIRLLSLLSLLLRLSLLSTHPLPSR